MRKAVALIKIICLNLLYITSQLYAHGVAEQIVKINQMLATNKTGSYKISKVN